MIPNLVRGDCLEALREFAASGTLFDACITDPPYHLTSIVRRFGAPGAAERASRGFMGKQWDGGDIAFRPETWQAVWRVMKPGAHLVAFGGSRGYHRMACAIEDAGFEIRDSLMFLYGTGFPKSHNLHGEWQGWGTALKPAYEPIVLARKPLIGTVAANVTAHGTGAINIDACRIETDDDLNGGTYSQSTSVSGKSGSLGGGPLRNASGVYVQPSGRHPANVLHDGSDEVLEAFAAFGERPGQQGRAKADGSLQGNAIYGTLRHGTRMPEPRGDSGTAARFFYSAKASAADRVGSKHPTVKPIALMRWLCKLVTPPGGHILDPFAGSGTTLQAAYECGFSATGCEREPEYQADIERRIIAMTEQGKLFDV